MAQEYHHLQCRGRSPDFRNGCTGPSCRKSALTGHRASYAFLRNIRLWMTQIAGTDNRRGMDVSEIYKILIMKVLFCEFLYTCFCELVNQ